MAYCLFICVLNSIELELEVSASFKPNAGSAKANGREPKTCLGRVFNHKLGCFNDVHVFVYVDTRPYL